MMLSLFARNKGKGVKLMNNSGILNALQQSDITASYDKSIKSNKDGSTLLGINNKQGELDRIAKITRFNDKYFVDLLASHPMKIIEGTLDPDAIPNLVIKLKKDTNNSKLYFQGIDNTVKRLYTMMGARVSKDIPDHLEFKRHSKLARF